MYGSFAAVMIRIGVYFYYLYCHQGACFFFLAYEIFTKCIVLKFTKAKNKTKKTNFRP